MENSVAAHYLTIHYHLPAGSTILVGVALYVPSTDSLYLRFRDDLNLDDPYDFEFLAETSSTFRIMADEKGAKATFDWMSDTLSNAIYVEGPTAIRTCEPEKTARELCERNDPSSAECRA